MRVNTVALFLPPLYICRLHPFCPSLGGKLTILPIISKQLLPPPPSVEEEKQGGEYEKAEQPLVAELSIFSLLHKPSSSMPT